MTPSEGSQGGAKAPVRAHRPERITLDVSAMERVTAWMDDLASLLKGSTVNRTELVNWLINHHDRELSAQEVRGLEQAFFDEVKFAEWAVTELKAAQARGESVTLSEIIAKHRPARVERSRSDERGRRAPKPTAAVQADPVQNELQNDSLGVEKKRNFLDKNREN